MQKIGSMVCLFILVGLLATHCMATPAQLPTRHIQNSMNKSFNESENACIPCQCVGVCCGRCCYPPVNYCIIIDGQCYCAHWNRCIISNYITDYSLFFSVQETNIHWHQNSATVQNIIMMLMSFPSVFVQFSIFPVFNVIFFMIFEFRI